MRLKGRGQSRTTQGWAPRGVLAEIEALRQARRTRLTPCRRLLR
ncbi:MAG TPA: hypothetical protein VF060_01790 [Trebonia sp.]